MFQMCIKTKHNYCLRLKAVELELFIWRHTGVVGPSIQTRVIGYAPLNENLPNRGCGLTSAKIIAYIPRLQSVCRENCGKSVKFRKKRIYIFLTSEMVVKEGAPPPTGVFYQ